MRKPSQHRTQHKAQRQQSPQLRRGDFTFSRAIDNVGIHVTVSYLGTPIYVYTLVTNDLLLWERLNQAMKFDFLAAKLNQVVFGSDMEIMQMVIIKIMQTIDNTFRQAHRAEKNGQVQNQ